MVETKKIPIKNFFFLFLITFLIGIIIGIFFIEVNTGEIKKVNINFSDIFLNNITVGITLIIGGFMTFGFLNFFIILINGVVVGEVIKFLFVNNQELNIVTGLLPHGIVEILGLVAFSIAGILPINYIYSFYLKKYKNIKIKHYIIALFLLIVMGTLLLFISGVLETSLSQVNYRM